MRTIYSIIAGLCIISSSLCAQEAIMSVTGTVIDQTNRNFTSVMVSFYDENNKKAGSSKSNSTTGYYFVTGLKQGKKYKIQLESPDYFKDEMEISLPKTNKYAEISRDFTVKPLAKGTKILLDVPPFELKKSKLRVGAEDYLADIQKMMMLNPGVSIEIQSYPDMASEPESMQKFTDERANAIKAFLVEKGVKDTRIFPKGSNAIDSVNPPPMHKTAKGKRYIGTTYIVIVKA